MFAGDVLDQELIAYIRALRSRFKTALLSNATVRLVSTLRDEWHIEDCFDVIVISAQVGLMKPDPAIFRLTLERLNVTPRQAVFIDDMPENVSAAMALGLHAIRFTSRQALLEEIQPLLQSAKA
jgi:putative hydrolase of the HAD superfamily